MRWENFGNEKNRRSSGCSAAACKRHLEVLVMRCRGPGCSGCATKTLSAGIWDHLLGNITKDVSRSKELIKQSTLILNPGLVSVPPAVQNYANIFKPSPLQRLYTDC